MNEISPKNINSENDVQVALWRHLHIVFGNIPSPNWGGAGVGFISHRSWGGRQCSTIHITGFPAHCSRISSSWYSLGVALINSFVIRRVALQGSHPAAKDTDRSSYAAVQVAGILAIVAGVICRYMDWAVAPAWVQWAALAIAAFGIAFREWAVITLGRNFSRTVEIKEGQRLVTSGPYRRFRHPAYTGMVLIYIGLALALGSWLGGHPGSNFDPQRNPVPDRVEEPVLIEAFGEEYKGYMQRTWMLFPGW